MMMLLKAETREACCRSRDETMTTELRSAYLQRAKRIRPDKWLSPNLWNALTKHMPIACVDMIFEREDRSILYGWRIISPYSRTWALPGGRLLHRENLIACAKRIAREYGLGFGNLYLVGVFPTTFSRRSDLVVSLAALRPTGDATVDNV